jgi:hypothetical protein
VQAKQNQNEGVNVNGGRMVNGRGSGSCDRAKSGDSKSSDGSENDGTYDAGLIVQPPQQPRSENDGTYDAGLIVQPPQQPRWSLSI